MNNKNHMIQNYLKDHPCNLYSWQAATLNQIKNCFNVILSSPTGSGKTIIFTKWAFNLVRLLEKQYNQEFIIIITSPIKALSSQRFKEFKEIAALETGDVTYLPQKYKILCCTTEIYLSKYINETNVILILDEFHFCFENTSRTRAFIDSLIYSNAMGIFICSATLGNSKALNEYINTISGREFTLIENDERPTELLDLGEIPIKNIHNSLLVAFSVKNCQKILDVLFNQRLDNLLTIKSKRGKNSNAIISNLLFEGSIPENTDRKYIKQLEKIMDKFKLIERYAEIYDVSGQIVLNAKLGLAIFHGKILPKEKEFIAELFEKKLIDTVIGTDALSIGVNFPIKQVIFCQLIKMNKRISKNLFDQIAGRAGRKGFYNTGYFGFSDAFKVEHPKYNLAELYKELMSSENESFTIQLTPNLKLLLQGLTTIEKEAEHICTYSTVPTIVEQVKEEIKDDLNKIEIFLTNPLITETIKESIKTLLPSSFFPEYTIEENLEKLYSVMLEDNFQRNILNDTKLINLNDKEEILDYLANNYSVKLPKFANHYLNYKSISSEFISTVLSCYSALTQYNIIYTNPSDYYELLKFRKYITLLPPSVSNVINISMIEHLINNVDLSTLNFINVDHTQELLELTNDFGEI